MIPGSLNGSSSQNVSEQVVLPAVIIPCGDAVQRQNAGPVKWLWKRQLWSETYDRELIDIFAVQDEIAAAVVEQLKVALLGTPLPRRDGGSLAKNPEAYDAYLKGIAYLNKLGPSNFKRAAEFFEQTVTIAPDSALAWARLSYANTRFASQAQSGHRLALSRAREAATRALELDRMIPEAHIASAYINLAFDWNWKAAEAAQQQLLADYGDRAAYQQAIVYSNWGDYAKAIEWLERAYAARDPGLATIKLTSAFKPMHDLPGYLAVLKKMNLED